MRPGYKTRAPPQGPTYSSEILSPKKVLLFKTTPPAAYQVIKCMGAHFIFVKREKERRTWKKMGMWL